MSDTEKYKNALREIERIVKGATTYTEGGMIVLKGKALPALGDILRVVGEAMEMSDD